jgi:hypothetical protein
MKTTTGQMNIHQKMLMKELGEHLFNHRQMFGSLSGEQILLALQEQVYEKDLSSEDGKFKTGIAVAYGVEVKKILDKYTELSREEKLIPIARIYTGFLVDDMVTEGKIMVRKGR